jgi:hypothetical protein
MMYLDASHIAASLANPLQQVEVHTLQVLLRAAAAAQSQAMPDSDTHHSYVHFHFLMLTT